MGSGASFPVKYLSLRGASGWPLFIHDIVPTVLSATLISVPFILVSSTNYFHKDGFLDKFGTFSSVLTGFYVAGLVAVATFSTQSSALDEKIEVGPVFLHESAVDEKHEVQDEDNRIIKNKLTRRQYLCQMFGYLATLSMMLTFLTIISVIVSQAIKLPPTIDITSSRYIPRDFLRAVIIILFSIPVAHLITTTGRGLFYLVDRLYDRKPKILPKR